MRTNTRVEFGLYDVTARGDSTPSCTTAKPFCNLGRDLLLESVPSQNKYGTLEREQWLMDGSFSFFPEVPDINTMEQVQWSMYELWRRNAQRSYTGEICAGQTIGVI